MALAAVQWLQAGVESELWKGDKVYDRNKRFHSAMQRLNFFHGPKEKFPFYLEGALVNPRGQKDTLDALKLLGDVPYDSRVGTCTGTIEKKDEQIFVSVVCSQNSHKSETLCTAMQSAIKTLTLASLIACSSKDRWARKTGLMYRLCRGRTLSNEILTKLSTIY